MNDNENAERIKFTSIPISVIRYRMCFCVMSRCYYYNNEKMKIKKKKTK